VLHLCKSSSVRKTPAKTTWRHDLLAATLEKLELGQRALGRRLKVEGTTVGRWVSGAVIPDGPAMYALCKFLQVGIGYFFGDDPLEELSRNTRGLMDLGILPPKDADDVLRILGAERAPVARLVVYGKGGESVTVWIEGGTASTVAAVRELLTPLRAPPADSGVPDQFIAVRSGAEHRYEPKGKAQRPAKKT